MTSKNKGKLCRICSGIGNDTRWWCSLLGCTDTRGREILQPKEDIMYSVSPQNKPIYSMVIVINIYYKILPCHPCFLFTDWFSGCPMDYRPRTLRTLSIYVTSSTSHTACMPADFIALIFTHGFGKFGSLAYKCSNR